MVSKFETQRFHIVTTHALTALFVSAIAACSGSSPSITTCGVGTKVVGTDCVALDGGGSDAAAGDAQGNDASGSTDGKAQEADAIAPDDPCPATVNVNCSDTCGGRNADCDNTTCGSKPDGGQGGQKIVLTDYSQLPYVMRTPRAPRPDPECPASCAGTGGLAPKFAMAIRVSMPTLRTGIRAYIALPWRIRGYGSSYPFCAYPPVDNCHIADNAFSLLIETDDPEAPARNLIIEEMPAGSTTCP